MNEANTIKGSRKDGAFNSNRAYLLNKTTDMFHRSNIVTVPTAKTKFVEEIDNLFKTWGLKNTTVEIFKNNTNVFIQSYKDTRYYLFWYKCCASVIDSKAAKDIFMDCLAVFPNLENDKSNKFIYEYFSEKGYCNIKSIKSSDNVRRGYFQSKIGKCYFKYYVESENIVNEKKKGISAHFDNMDGLEFEKFCAGLLEKNGYNNISVTKGSADQGVDIIAFRDGVKYGIQCKCYSSYIGNKAVQEIYAGKHFYHCHVGIVLTNRFFTSSAIELAEQNGIILWDRNKLMEMINKAEFDK